MVKLARKIYYALIGNNPKSMPIYFPSVPRLFKRKEAMNLKDACLCANFDKMNDIKFFKLEEGIIYIYQSFYNKLQ